MEMHEPWNKFRDSERGLTHESCSEGSGDEQVEVHNWRAIATARRNDLHENDLGMFESDVSSELNSCDEGMEALGVCESGEASVILRPPTR